MENLKSRVKITPQSIANTNLEEIEIALKPAGLYKTKSRKIKEASQVIVEKYNGDIYKILNQPMVIARKLLLELPGVSKKRRMWFYLLSEKVEQSPSILTSQNR